MIIILPLSVLSASFCRYHPHYLQLSRLIASVVVVVNVVPITAMFFHCTVINILSCISSDKYSLSRGWINRSDRIPACIGVVVLNQYIGCCVGWIMLMSFCHIETLNCVWSGISSLSDINCWMKSIDKCLWKFPNVFFQLCVSVSKQCYNWCEKNDYFKR